MYPSVQTVFLLAVDCKLGAMCVPLACILYTRRLCLIANSTPVIEQMLDPFGSIKSYDTVTGETK
jgi:hypothetical protein